LSNITLYISTAVFQSVLGAVATKGTRFAWVIAVLGVWTGFAGVCVQVHLAGACVEEDCYFLFWVAHEDITYVLLVVYV